MTHLYQVEHETLNQLNLQVNWWKIKIQTTDFSFSLGSCVPVAGDNVKVVESFTYFGVDIHNTGSTEQDIRKRIAIARNSTSSLDRNIWHTSITLLLQSYDYTKTWSPTRQLSRNIYAFDQWCLRRIL